VERTFEEDLKTSKWHYGY